MATTCVADTDPRTPGFVTCRKAGETDAWDTDAFVAHLRSRGVPIGPGGVGCGEDVTGPFVRVHLPTGYDPTADVDTFSPPPNAYRTAVSYLKRRARTIKAIAPASRTTAEKDLLALLIVLRSDD